MKFTKKEFLMITIMYKASVLYYENLIKKSENEKVESILIQTMEQLKNFYNSIDRQA